MKAQCERCKEIVALEFAARPAGIDVTCPACRETYFVPAAVAASAAPAPAPAAPAAAAAAACPKCGEPQAGDACRRCGLVRARWKGFVAAADATEVDLQGAREAAARWDACEAGWDDPALHEAFLAHVQRTSAYAFAAARYRAAQAKRGGHDPVAAERLRQIRAVAELTMRRPPAVTALDAGPRYKGVMAVAVILVALFLAGGALLLYLDGAPPRNRARPAPAERPR